jgi:hypothetical protein
MSLIAARRTDDGPELTLQCDVCKTRGEGRLDQLAEAGWFVSSISITPHCCPACAEVRREHLEGERARSRQPALAPGEIPDPC